MRGGGRHACIQGPHAPNPRFCQGELCPGTGHKALLAIAHGKSAMQGRPVPQVASPPGSPSRLPEGEGLHCLRQPPSCQR